MKRTYKNPVCPNAADPFVLLHDGKYYLYATTAPLEGFKVLESDDLITWEDKGFCLKKDDVIGEKDFWAPEVMFYNNKFYMAYSAEEHIAIAVSDSPLGPFKQDEKKWLIECKAIDGNFLLMMMGMYIYITLKLWIENTIMNRTMLI